MATPDERPPGQVSAEDAIYAIDVAMAQLAQARSLLARFTESPEWVPGDPDTCKHLEQQELMGGNVYCANPECAQLLYSPE